MASQHQRIIVFSCVALLCSSALRASQATATAPLYRDTFTSHHTALIDGKRVQYTATVKSTVLTDRDGKPAVNFVSTDYIADQGSSRDRPVIFAFAGGPSGPSVAYHLRLLGPRQFIDGGQRDGIKGGHFRDNPDCLLDIADLVFVDPAETGFSRILPAGKRAYFYSVAGDASSIEQFMDQWLHEHGRDDAPRYVMGGSYGSVRATRIAWDLREKHPLNGFFMTANSLMLQEEVGVIGLALPLPTMANIAVYYGKVPRVGRTDAEIVDEAYSFAIKEYLPALSLVQDLPQQSREAVAKKMQGIIGIPAEVILRKDLAVSLDDFKQLLLKDEGKILSDPYDARHNSAAGARREETDEGLNVAFRHYMKDELHVTYDMSQYAMHAPDSGKVWEYKGPDAARRADGGNDWPKMLKDVMDSNPTMLVYSANGLYDQMGVVGQVRWLMSRTQLPRNRILIREYPGGHALYADPPVAARVLQDLRALLTQKAIH
jgi:carboxypeptidase C (cathepsin A)